jgi:hypothetical protein
LLTSDFVSDKRVTERTSSPTWGPIDKANSGAPRWLVARSGGVGVNQRSRLDRRAKLHADSRHDLAVQVPSGVPEHGDDEDETKECGY